MVPGQWPQAGPAGSPRRKGSSPQSTVSLCLFSDPGARRTAPFLSEPATARETRQCGLGGGDAQAIVTAERFGPPRNAMGAVGRIGGSYSSLAKKLDFMPRILFGLYSGMGAATSAPLRSSMTWASSVCRTPIHLSEVIVPVPPAPTATPTPAPTAPTPTAAPGVHVGVVGR